jgi:hypothetical protein
MIEGKMEKGQTEKEMEQFLWRAGQQKKELYQTWLHLIKGNHADFLRIFFTRAEYLILTLLAHPGDQELPLGKLVSESFDFTVAGHADMLLHLGNSVREEQVSRSWLDAWRVRNREFVAHADTSERELRDGFFDINNPASQVRFYVGILDISILAFMASFAVWISLALGKYLNGLRYQP